MSTKDEVFNAIQSQAGEIQAKFEELKGRAEVEKTAVCSAFHANIGDIMRAGFDPTLGQTPKLMDNPTGDVANWLNQFDFHDFGCWFFLKSRSMPVSLIGGKSVRIALLLGWLVVFGLGCSEPEPEIFIRPVRSIVVGDVGAFSSGSYPGQAKALQEVDLGFEVSGQLIERPVAVGDLVQPSRLLARLDPRDYEARLASAKGVHGTAKANYQRSVALVRQGVLAEIVMDQRRAVFDAADGELRLAQKGFDDTRMYAPFAATVSVTYVDNFQNVQAKQPVIRLLDLSKIEMVVGIPEDAITLAPYITDVKVRFDAFPDREFPAEIVEIGAEASHTTRTYPVTLLIDPPEDIEIKPGMAGQAKATAELPEDLNRTGIDIPASAVFSPSDQQSQQSFVWILQGEPLSVSQREVKVLGVSQRGVLVQGLAAGDRIVTAGVHSLSESQTVRLLDSASSR